MYADGGDGTAWEYELIYYPTSTDTGGVEGRKRPNPDSVRGVGVRSLGADPELYRWHWLIKNNRDEDGYAPLVGMLQAYGQSSGSPSYHDDMRRLLDVDQWLRAFAVQVLFGIGDNYSSGSSHNAIFYRRPEDGKFLYFPWDMDFTFRRGATSTMTPNGDLDKLLTDPANQRAYYGHIEDIVSTTFNTGYMTYWANHYSCFLPTESLTGFLSYISTRSNHALNGGDGVNNVIPPVAFDATTPDTSTGGTTIDIEGDGWVDVRELRLAGNPNPLEVTWTDNNSWRVTVPVAPGANAYVIEAYDFQGAPIGTDTVNVTGTGAVLPAAAGKLVISELMYHPSAGAGADTDDFEYVELLNIHPGASVDLTGVEFVDGITYAFPPMTLAPGARLLVVRDLAAFSSRYGAGLDIAGEYRAPDGSNKLADGGETVELVDALGVEIAKFEYSDDLPWPSSAAGDGYSLELINPAAPATDAADPIHWRSSRGIDGTPGGSDAATLAGWAAANGIVDLTLDRRRPHHPARGRLSHRGGAHPRERRPPGWRCSTSLSARLGEAPSRSAACSTRWGPRRSSRSPTRSISPISTRWSPPWDTGTSPRGRPRLWWPSVGWANSGRRWARGGGSARLSIRCCSSARAWPQSSRRRDGNASTPPHPAVVALVRGTATSVDSRRMGGLRGAPGGPGA